MSRRFAITVFCTTPLSPMHRQRKNAVRLVSFLPVIFLFALSIFANAEEVSLENYRDRIAKAEKAVQGVLDELGTDANSVCEEAERSSWSPTFHLLPEGRDYLRMLLPARETVAFDGRTVAVEHKTALELLEQQKNALDCATSFTALSLLHSHLSVLHDHLSAGRIPLENAPADISQILQRREFQIEKKRDSQFDQFKKWLAEKIASWLGGSAPKVESASYGKALTFFLALGLAVGGGILAWLLYKRFRTRRTPSNSSEKRVILGEVIAEDASSDSLLSDALKLAQSGEHRLAVRKIYIALLHEMDNRQIIRIDPGLTNREYLQSVRSQLRLYPAMREMTDRFDEFWYGQRNVQAEDYEKFLMSYREAAAALPAAA